MYPENKTLRHLLHCLKKIAKEEPNALDLPLIYAMDEEGNSYSYVYFSPTTTHYNEDEGMADMTGEKEVNAICIN